jgi:predicted amidohydrolase
MKKQDKIVVAALQMTPIHLNKQATVEKLCEWIVEAGRSGVEFVVTPRP